LREGSREVNVTEMDDESLTTRPEATAGGEWQQKLGNQKVGRVKSRCSFQLKNKGEGREEEYGDIECSP